jgi:hypothetical protein
VTSVSYFMLWFIHLFFHRSRRAWLFGACCLLRFLFGPFVFVDVQSILELVRLSILIFVLSWPVLSCSDFSAVVNSFAHLPSVYSELHTRSSVHRLPVLIFSLSFLRVLHRLVLMLLDFHFAKGSHLFVQWQVLAPRSGFVF